MSDEPFGRQPMPVKVTLAGESIDVNYWTSILIRYIESQGPITIKQHGNIFTIYPHAVND